MDILLMIVCATILFGLLVFIHEGGHFLVARACGVRVSEFMLGLPGPSVGFTKGGTRFGITAVPLGGYANVCGMLHMVPEERLKRLMTFAYERGTITYQEAATELAIPEQDAYDTLEELVSWGSLKGKRRTDKVDTYRTPAIEGGEEGVPHFLEDCDAFFSEERAQQYFTKSLPKRFAILVAGSLVNLLYAILVFVILYSIIGFDVQVQATGEIVHHAVDPLRAIVAGFQYIGLVFMAIVGLFNPETAAQTVSNSTSIVGIAVISKSAFEQGISSFLSLSAAVSVSLGLMNLLPVPPLDGGRIFIELIQKCIGRPVSVRTQEIVTTVGIALFVLLFLVMLNQDIQRFVLGNWG